MNNALKQMIAEIEGIRNTAPTGAVGNVYDNEVARFIANPVDKSNQEMQMFNAMSNGAGNRFTSPIEEMRALQQKGGSGDGFLTDVEVNRFIELRNQLNPNLPQERLLTTVREPVDIDGASAPPNPMSMEELNQFLENIYRARIPRESYPQPIKPSKPFKAY
jgi:hypothetical protein